MRSPINIVGGFYKDPNKHWSAQDTLNWIPVKSERSGTRTEWQFRDAPGVKPLVKLGVNDGETFIEAGPGRGLRNVEGKLFAVAGNTLFQITNDLVSIPYGTIPGVNRVSMAHNQYGSANQLLTVNGSAGYVFNTSTLVFEKITDTGYPGAFVADYVDGYLAQVESLGRYWFHSDLAEAREYNTLDQYEAEGDPDRIVTLHVAYREVLLFGADTIEPYVNAPRGSGIAPFQRAANTVIQCGCSAKFSPRNIAGVVPFLDDKRVVQYLQGYSVNRISTVGIEQALGECSREEIANAYAYTYEDRGHKIYYLTVPGRFTFGYDFLTQEWHRRATSGLPDLAFTDVAFWNGMWVALDRRYGRLYELDWGYKLDSCEPFVRERVTGVLSNNQNRVTVNELELLFNVGAEESVCAPFFEQPEGPAISGDAPGGSIGSPYTFTYTTTPGDSPIAKTILFGDDVTDFGLTWDQATATLSGTPTQTGAIDITVRTIDQNGLWAEVDDVIEIGLAMLAIRNRVVTGQTFGDYLRGGSGGDFTSATWTQYTNAVEQDPTFLYGIGERFIAYATTGSFRYTDDYGATWGTATGADSGGSGGDREAFSVGDVILIPGGVNEIRKSIDAGSSYAVVTGSPDVNIIAGDEDNLVGIRDADNASYLSVDLGETWTPAAAPGLVAPLASCGFLFDGFQHFGGATTGPVAALRRTLNGAAFASVTLPAFATATQVTAACLTEIGGQPAYVLGTNSGELAYFDPADDTVKLSASVMDVQCRGITFNGGIVAAIGSAGGRGQIWTSADGGVTWTKQRDETGQTGEWNAIASMRES